MKYLIKKGKQRASPSLFDVWFKPPTLNATVVFSEDCKYNLDGDENTNTGDDDDINKLFGLGFLNFKKFPFHHYESVRVGWVWNSVKSQIDLFAYYYIKGVRKTEYIRSVPWGLPVEISISASRSYYTIEMIYGRSRATITSTLKMERGITSLIGYTLGVYFGGNRKAPHDISLFIYNL